MASTIFDTLPYRIVIRDDYPDRNLAGMAGTIKVVDYETRNVLIRIDDKKHDIRKWVDFKDIRVA